MTRFVPITHPNVDGITKVAESALPAFEESGWKKASDTALKAVAKAEAEEVAAALQTPTADEVAVEKPARRRTTKRS